MVGCDPVIREAREQDREAIMAILETANFHHIPSLEMPELDLSRCFVAEEEGRILGMAGYTMLAPDAGKTTLMVVDPSLRGSGLGMALQKRRLAAMRNLGARTVTTNADLPHVITWYKKHFGYREVGQQAKLHSFGDTAIGHWTTLRMDLKNEQEEGKTA